MKSIKKAMRKNEVELLAHLRKNGAPVFFGRAWHNALDRLLKGKRVVYRDGRYQTRKGSHPVTGAVR